MDACTDIVLEVGIPHCKRVTYNINPDDVGSVDLGRRHDPPRSYRVCRKFLSISGHLISWIVMMVLDLADSQPTSTVTW